jgi:DNA-binding GntR family transcriptional regulator
MAKFDKIVEMARGVRQYHSWRLHDLTEEQEQSANASIYEGHESFEEAFDLLDKGDREAAVAALKRASSLAEKAISAIKG